MGVTATLETPDQTPDQAERADDLCHCGEIRALHNPCSVCRCPFFRPASRVKAKTYARRKGA